MIAETGDSATNRDMNTTKHEKLLLGKQPPEERVRKRDGRTPGIEGQEKPRHCDNTKRIKRKCCFNYRVPFILMIRMLFPSVLLWGH